MKNTYRYISAALALLLLGACNPIRARNDALSAAELEERARKLENAAADEVNAKLDQLPKNEVSIVG